MFNYWKIKEENFDLRLEVKQLEKEKATLLFDLEGVQQRLEGLERELALINENKELIKINREILELEREKDRMALKMQVEAMREEMMSREM